MAVDSYQTLSRQDGETLSPLAFLQKKGLKYVIGTFLVSSYIVEILFLSALTEWHIRLGRQRGTLYNVMSKRQTSLSHKV